ncbi:hypothetical protein HDR58_04675 [bacterium]|nr:hypothetical protein [bacterium]
MLPKICLVLPYFGKLPQYWGGFIDSCADNPDIDFLIISDCELGKLPNNVQSKYIAWADMQKYIQQKFKEVGINKTFINNPYKLCDYKPTYGYLFQDELRDYDFWGYIDCDLVFGNLSKFLIQIDINNFDRVHRAGHLSVFRNKTETNFLFLEKEKGIINFKDVAASTLIYQYDESAINQLFKAKKLKFFEGGFDSTFSIWDYTYRWRNAGKHNQGELFVKKKDGTTVAYTQTDSGEIVETEVNYIHYMTKKNVTIPIGQARPFCITHNGVISFDEKTSIAELISKYTLCNKDQQEIFKRNEIKKFRQATYKRIINEFKYNGFYTFVELYNRFSSWLKHQRLMHT